MQFIIANSKEEAAYIQNDIEKLPQAVRAISILPHTAGPTKWRLQIMQMCCCARSIEPS